ncbi:inovirus-type Gp2 protein [Acinetobacter junii]|uniref:YagK/YfjJ domain-containing protein n=1 Tax=Acinetobacter junii TaxID=40215 RepID=UPI0036013B1B
MIIRRPHPKSKLKKTNRKFISKLQSLSYVKEDLETSMYSDDFHRTIFICPLDRHIEPLIKKVEFVLKVLESKSELVGVSVQQMPLRRLHSQLNCDAAIYPLLKCMSSIINRPIHPQIIEGIECQAFNYGLDQLTTEEFETIQTNLNGLLPLDHSTVILYEQAINQFISHIRCFMNKPEIKRKLYDRASSCNRMKDQCSALVQSLIKQHSKILVIRLDFYLIHQSSTLLKKSHVLQEIHSKHDLEYLKGCVKRFLRMKRNHPLMKEIIGHIFRYEYTPQRGFHIHSFLFFDANKHREDITIGQAIAKIWNGKITGGQGSTNNCNFKKGSYRYCGIGMIHYSDVDKLKYLFRTFEYICKADQFFAFSNLEGARRFQLSQAPQKKSKAGRPRKVNQQSEIETQNHDNNMEQSS